nr:MAG: wsv206-like protein [Penaeus semisulcatus pemonivirus]
MSVSERDRSFMVLSSIILKRLRRAIDHSNNININVEFGYGGARAMDVRWTGPATFAVWRAILLELRDTSSMIAYPRINLVGSSVGNLIIFSLTVLLPVAWRCCVTTGRRNGGTGRDRRLSIDLHIFNAETGLNFFPDTLCACDAIRRLLDAFLEDTAGNDHPLLSKAQTVYCNRFDTFLSTQTTLHHLLDNHPHSASTYTRLFGEERLRYMVLMFRAITKLESKLCSFYILARRILQSVTSQLASTEPLGHRCSFFVASQSLSVSEFRIDRWLDTGTPDTLIPLVSLVERASNHRKSSDGFSEDADRFNQAMDLLLGSVDIRDMVMPVISTVIMGVMPKRLLIKYTHPTSVEKKKDYFPTQEEPGQLCQVAYRKRHVLDIMSPNVRSLPEFDSYLKRLQEQETGVQFDILPTFHTNYVFEMSPQSRHLFPSQRITALISGCSPPPILQIPVETTHSRKRQIQMRRQQCCRQLHPFVNI